jgi:hypothetical protein
MSVSKQKTLGFATKAPAKPKLPFPSDYREDIWARREPRPPYEKVHWAVFILA